MTWDEGQAAAQLLLEERVGAAARAADNEEAAGDAATRDLIRATQGRG